MARKIFVGNYKGGVGKTTSVFHIAKYIADLESDKKVLMIDLDPQCSLSEICMNKIKDKNLENLDDDESLNYVLDVYHKKFNKYDNINMKLNIEKLTKKYNDNVHFIPSNLFHKKNERGLDIIVSTLQKFEHSIFILNQFILENNLDEAYDYIIFDCPPTNNIITQSAFLISDYYLIPTIMDNVSSRGVLHYIKSVDKMHTNYCEKHEDSDFMKAVFKEKPLLIGVFETLYKYNVKNEDVKDDLDRELNNTAFADLEKDILKEIGQNNNKIILNTKISNYIDIARNTAVGYIHPRSEGYRDLTKEIIERINKYEETV